MSIEWAQASQGVYRHGKLGPYDIKMWPATDTDPSFAIVEVPSARDAEKTYSVVVSPAGTECTCSSAAWRPWIVCRHRKEVERLVGDL